jgi:hypothetical protein
MVDGHTYHEHRLAWFYMKGVWPKGDIDHIKGDKSDNRITNLREATTSQNKANERIRVNNTSGYKGVTWHRKRRKWEAHIGVNGKGLTLGYFDSPERAFIAYMKAAWDHFGDFALIDADYLKAIRERKAQKGWERDVLQNLARPDPNYMAA